MCPLKPSIWRVVTLYLSCVVLPETRVPQVQELGQQLAMHAAGMRPQYLDRASVPPAAVERERALLREQVTQPASCLSFVSELCYALIHAAEGAGEAACLPVLV